MTGQIFRWKDVFTLAGQVEKSTSGVVKRWNSFWERFWDCGCNWNVLGDVRIAGLGNGIGFSILLGGVV